MMKTRSLLVALLLVASAIAAYLILRPEAGPQASGPAPSRPDIAGSASAPVEVALARTRPDATHAMPAGPETTPAWLQAPPVTTSSVSSDPVAGADAVAVASAAENARLARMTAVMTRLQQLQSDPQPRTADLVAAFDDLQRANGSPIVGGVRIDVLRNNVVVAEKMQAVAEEMRRLQGGPDGSSAQNQTLVQARMAEMETLRKQLSADVLQGAVAR